MQNQHRSDLIDDVFAVARATAYRIEMAMRFGGAQSLVPQMNRQLKFLAKRPGEFFGGFGARASVAGKMNGPADHNGRATITPHQASQRPQIVSAVCMNDREQRLRGEAEFIGNRDANPALTVIEAEDSRLRRQFHVG